MKILLISTRNPYGRQTGRKSVLRTIIGSCHSLGHEVRVLAITNEEIPKESNIETIEAVAPPGLIRVFVNVITKAFIGRLCLNECLYVSPNIQSHVNKICDSWEPDIVVADMIRTASTALATGRPTHVDIDDLLSKRYNNLANGRVDASSILGYYGTHIPAFARTGLAKLAARLIGIEAKLVAKREEVIARQANSVSLVAKEEAESFEHHIKHSVAWLPMAITIPELPANVASNPNHMIVFVGGLDYHANLESVRIYNRDVYPALNALEDEPPPLRIIGYCPTAVRDEMGSSPGVVLMDYVDDLTAELAGARAFVAPIPPGTGLKTKVLEAMAAGLPVVSTSHGVQGFPAVDGEHCLITNTGEGMARAINKLRYDPDLAAKIGENGRALVTELFAPEVITQRWKDVLAQIQKGPLSSA
ncbi:MAG: glycosyltransferase family 4 protein [Acidimicrobiales bacterium]